jgi:hypothetical protein
MKVLKSLLNQNKMVEQNKKQEKITIEQALEMPELAHLHEAMRYAQSTPFKDMFPKKHEMSIKRTVISRTNKLFEEYPSMPLKNVVSTILGGLKEDISSELVLKMTLIISDKWEELSLSTASKQVKELV